MTSKSDSRRGRIRGSALVLAFVVLAVAQGPAAGQEGTGAVQDDDQRPRFGGRVDLMVLPVSVVDDNGLPVHGLSPEDFIILEDGIEQGVALLLNPHDAPLDIALLMDVSDSMREIEETARSSALQFLDRLSDDDCVLLLRFTGILGPGIWGSPSDKWILAAINETPMQGGSAVRDAVAAGFHRLEHDTDRCSAAAAVGKGDGSPQRRRPALVVVTDGRDEHSSLTVTDTLSIARQAGATFFPVGIGGIARSVWTRNRLDTENRGHLEAMARVTGGQFIQGGTSVERLDAAYGEVIQWLRSYYLVGYYPSSPNDAQLVSEIPSWHEVEVRVRQPGYEVRTREGFYRSSVDVFAAARHVQTGIDRLAQGERDEALAEFALAQESDPYSWEACYQLGKVLMLKRQMQDAQRALLSAAGLCPGQGEAHELASRVSLALGDYETAWDQAIRAQQAGIDMIVEQTLLRQDSVAPANLEERLHAPSVYVGAYSVFDLAEQAAIRRVSQVLARQMAETPEIGLVDQQDLADYWLLIKLTRLSEKSPRELEAELELWRPERDADIPGPEGPSGRRAIGRSMLGRKVRLTDVEDKDLVAAELEPHIADILFRVSGQQ